MAPQQDPTTDSTMTKSDRAGWVIGCWAEMESGLDALRAQVAAKHRELAESRKQLAAQKTSVEFWIYEASRWRTEAGTLRRAEVMERAERGER